MTAALLTYRSYKNIFARIEKKAPENADLELIKLHVIRGDSIEAAIEKVRAASEAREKPRSRAVPGKPEERTATDESLLKMREVVQRQGEQIQNLQEYVEELKQALVAKDRKISKLESRLKGFKKEAYSEVRKSKELQIRDSTIESLKKKNSAIKTGP